LWPTVAAKDLFLCRLVFLLFFGGLVIVLVGGTVADTTSCLGYWTLKGMNALSSVFQ
jgi:hypothetical protein